MCGVVAWVSTTPSVEAPTLRRMTKALAHRGPDGDEVHVSRDRRLAATLAGAGTTAFARSPDVLVRASRGQPLFRCGAMDFSERGRRDILGAAMAGSESETREAIVRPHRERFASRDRRPTSAYG